MKRSIVPAAVLLAIIAVVAGLLAHATTPLPCMAESAPASKPIADDVLTGELVNPTTAVDVKSFVIFDLTTNANVVSWECYPKDPNARAFRGMIEWRGKDPITDKPILGYIAIFSASKAGTYYIDVSCVKGNQLKRVSHEITVGGDDPIPPPPPPPPPPPVPGKRVVLVIQETGEADAKAIYAQTIQGLMTWTKASPNVWKWADPDLKTPAGQTPAWLQPFLNERQKRVLALPVLAVAECSATGEVGSIVGMVPLPATAAEAVAFVKDNGG